MPRCLDYLDVKGILQRCHTKTCSYGYFYDCRRVIFNHSDYLVLLHCFKVISILLRCQPFCLVYFLRFHHISSILYINCSAAELIGHRYIILSDHFSRSYQIHRAMPFTEEVVHENLYSLDLYIAMEVIYVIFKKQDNQIVQNFRAKAGLLGWWRLICCG